MQELLNGWLESSDFIAALVSIILNIAVAIAGVLPSAFITAGTVGILGFKTGLVILIIGEAAGAVVSFLLYRKGLKKLAEKTGFGEVKNKYVNRLKTSRGIEAFSIVVLLRLIPFVPSGLVTVTASFSRMSFQNFLAASTLGKIPALILEAAAVAYVFKLDAGWKWGIGLAVSSAILAFLWIKKNMEDKKR